MNNKHNILVEDKLKNIKDKLKYNVSSSIKNKINKGKRSISRYFHFFYKRKSSRIMRLIKRIK